MNRSGSWFTLAVAGMIGAPHALAAQNPAGHDMASHSHASQPVECTTLGTPPWTGLTEIDRERFEIARQSVGHLSTPEAAIAAGFRPALGDIPGMGVHYVNRERGRDGIHVDAPDHLMFAPVDGEPALVGAAYAFIDAPRTDEPLPYDSYLADWHDHPQFAPDGQTLHMLHVWFVPSSNGPFAGLNFWLPYHGAGIAPPSACWMADPEVAQTIQRVAFALVPPDNPIAEQVDEARGWTDVEELPRGRARILFALDEAAAVRDLAAWRVAADRFLGSLTEREQVRTAALLQILMNEQMSSAERARMPGR